MGRLVLLWWLLVATEAFPTANRRRSAPPLFDRKPFFADYVPEPANDQPTPAKEERAKQDPIDDLRKKVGGFFKSVPSLEAKLQAIEEATGFKMSLPALKNDWIGSKDPASAVDRSMEPTDDPITELPVNDEVQATESMDPPVEESPLEEQAELDPMVESVEEVKLDDEELSLSSLDGVRDVDSPSVDAVEQVLEPEDATAPDEIESDDVDQTVVVSETIVEPAVHVGEVVNEALVENNAVEEKPDVEKAPENEKAQDLSEPEEPVDLSLLPRVPLREDPIGTRPADARPRRTAYSAIPTPPGVSVFPPTSMRTGTPGNAEALKWKQEIEAMRRHSEGQSTSSASERALIREDPVDPIPEKTKKSSVRPTSNDSNAERPPIVRLDPVDPVREKKNSQSSRRTAYSATPVDPGVSIFPRTAVRVDTPGTSLSSTQKDVVPKAKRPSSPQERSSISADPVDPLLEKRKRMEGQSPVHMESNTDKTDPLVMNPATRSRKLETPPATPGIIFTTSEPTNVPPLAMNPAAVTPTSQTMRKKRSSPAQDEAAPPAPTGPLMMNPATVTRRQSTPSSEPTTIFLESEPVDVPPLAMNPATVSRHPHQTPRGRKPPVVETGDSKADSDMEPLALNPATVSKRVPAPLAVPSVVAYTANETKAPLAMNPATVDRNPSRKPKRDSPPPLLIQQDNWYANPSSPLAMNPATVDRHTPRKPKHDVPSPSLVDKEAPKGPPMSPVVMNPATLSKPMKKVTGTSASPPSWSSVGSSTGSALVMNPATPSSSNRSSMKPIAQKEQVPADPVSLFPRSSSPGVQRKVESPPVRSVEHKDDREENQKKHLFNFLTSQRVREAARMDQEVERVAREIEAKALRVTEIQQRARDQTYLESKRRGLEGDPTSSRRLAAAKKLQTVVDNDEDSVESSSTADASAERRRRNLSAYAEKRSEYFPSMEAQRKAQLEKATQDPDYELKLQPESLEQEREEFFEVAETVPEIVAYHKAETQVLEEVIQETVDLRAQADEKAELNQRLLLAYRLTEEARLRTEARMAEELSAAQATRMEDLVQTWSEIDSQILEDYDERSSVEEANQRSLLAYRLKLESSSTADESAERPILSANAEKRSEYFPSMEAQRKAQLEKATQDPDYELKLQPESLEQEREEFFEVAETVPEIVAYHKAETQVLEEVIQETVDLRAQADEKAELNQRLLLAYRLTEEARLRTEARMAEELSAAQATRMEDLVQTWSEIDSQILEDYDERSSVEEANQRSLLAYRLKLQEKRRVAQAESLGEQRQRALKARSMVDDASPVVVADSGLSPSVAAEPEVTSQHVPSDDRVDEMKQRSLLAYRLQNEPRWASLGMKASDEPAKPNEVVMQTEAPPPPKGASFPGRKANKKKRKKNMKRKK